jgi:hypothetical protein
LKKQLKTIAWRYQKSQSLPSGILCLFKRLSSVFV